MAVALIPLGWEALLWGVGAISAAVLLSKTADEVISQKKKAGIRREFPTEWLDKTLGEIEKASKRGNSRARTAKKLLTKKEYDK